jgi:hypothetical protein
MHLFTSVEFYQHRAEVCETATFVNYIQHFASLRNAWLHRAEISPLQKKHETALLDVYHSTATTEGRHIDFGVMTVGYLTKFFII